jgi:AcrR family transcriptional regulator
MTTVDASDSTDTLEISGDAHVSDAGPTAATPAGSATRERILEIALERFTTQGYAGTSLREIAEDLGFSKAALYYHFKSKQDILLALHLQVHRLTTEIEPLLADPPDAETWNRLVGSLIGIVMRNRSLFVLHFREQDAIGALHHADVVDQHGDANDGGVEVRLLAFLADPSAPAETRVRRVASLGTVVGALVGSAALADIPDDELEGILRRIALEVLRPTAG